LVSKSSDQKSISDFGFRISDLKSQISNLKSQIPFPPPLDLTGGDILSRVKDYLQNGVDALKKRHRGGLVYPATRL